jgi:hypothetical protein
LAHTLKHIAFRIWGTVFLGGIVGLWVLPALDFGFGPAWIPIPAAAVLLTVFLLLGWLFNRFALFLADRHIEEAVTWERLGSLDAAGASYEKALAVFDSFLMSPRTKRAKSGRLTSRLTRFYLAKTDKQHTSEAFIAYYLNTHPDDLEVAESWLRQARAGEGLEPRFHDTAARIGEALAQSRVIQQLLARLYLSENRTDFPALQTYRRATGGRGRSARAIANDVARLFLKDGRADEWALQLYLQAGADAGRRPELLNGIAACVQWIPETAHNKRMLAAGKRYLEGIDPEQLALMRVGFTPPKPIEPPVRHAGLLKMGVTLGRRLQHGLAGISSQLLRSVRAGHGLVKQLLKRLGSSALTRPVLNWAAVTLLSGVVIVLIINTIGYLARTRTAEKAAIPVPKVVTDKFTLQVAAYLKKKHAEQYVAHLKTLGVDAFWVEATRGNKKWYQVRVSHFPDKATARAYGQSLKQQGLIDDFYVANYNPS